MNRKEKLLLRAALQKEKFSSANHSNKERCLDFEKNNENGFDGLLEKISLQMENQPPKTHLNLWRLVWCQVKYFGGKIWILQAAAALLLVRFLSVDTAVSLTQTKLFKLSVLFSVFAALSILPLLQRSARYKMLEVEGVVWFSARRVMLARILIFMAGNVMLFLMVTGAGILQKKLDFLTLACAGVTPFLLASAGLLRMLKNSDLLKIRKKYLVLCIGIAVLFLGFADKILNLGNSCLAFSETVLLLGAAGYGGWQAAQLVRNSELSMYV